jgi:hypothetical protein
MVKNISFVPRRIKLVLNHLNDVLHLLSDSCLLFSEPIKFGLLFSDLLPSFVQVDGSGIWIFVENIKNSDENVSAQILVRFRIVNGIFPFVVWVF